MELRNHMSNDAVNETFGVVKGKGFQLLAEVFEILTHDIVRCHLLWLGVVTRAQNGNPVNVGKPWRSKRGIYGFA